ncbi:hypothetical protein DPMN_023782 [Dreissena polymorpha]|uniref:PNPLA domain-containing protein n=1 Tax=Dreissena polymorpha TaxID=45954 RepID=A0A9D4LNC0_DREPO|nr:hypothetical protein DPMN_023782 [Dreissena polymorpha]
MLFPCFKVLSHDGGCIRGFIILETLEAIEKEAGKPIKYLFDWIGGTSTGGIIALGIATGKTRLASFRYKSSNVRAELQARQS